MKPKVKLLLKDAEGNVLSEVAVVKAAKISSPAKRLYLEPYGAGVRLVWTAGFVDEFKDVATIEVERS